MKIISDYESKVDGLIKKWNARIEELTRESRHANQEGKKKYAEEIGLLIGNREATRRGLFRVVGSDEDLCLVCPGEIEPNDSGKNPEI
ncbi:MAG: hypothetical protein HY912_24660 [Desulfomonile tiedjei]|uniref:Uncharacterized protein n=1 Tax=Desulfomonile tiedjei TaxID=2358 RepID=A0A9D6V8T8_9BACT|nr:hypothetical protein [Desulfomonile tiedjei]